jgi:predicted alpha/beta superfamily hydrolase
LHEHSLGGLFALYVLFHFPETFQAYLVSSPAIWWDREVVWRFEENYRCDQLALNVRVFLTAGLLEEKKGDETQKRYRQVSNVRLLDQVLSSRNYAGLVWRTELFDGERTIP